MNKESRIKLNLPEDLSAQVRALIRTSYGDKGWTPGTTPFCCELIYDGIRFRSTVKRGICRAGMVKQLAAIRRPV